MIPIEEIAPLLQHIAQELKPFRTLEWDTGYHWRIMIEGYEILIFDDAGECDYVEWAVAPDGRRTTYEEWSAAAEPLWPVENYRASNRLEELEAKKLFKPIDPIHLLSPADHLALERIMDRELRSASLNNQMRSGSRT